ncbi:hypothetical protein GCM10017691_49600 [Pseudonocardia petroleophila]|uniref:DUF3558 domain-containing protein n=1 Tax=Pseudonocardia petroleophila TaxID=37331 RepID=A0A7G7MQ23_9PSEU|nr:hypothetical protein [Pseudonocardia petroleophila]QNG54884.1 hypothetical protein H6H00_14000 [Pseudonocardia petroleophila]
MNPQHPQQWPPPPGAWGPPPAPPSPPSRRSSGSLVAAVLAAVLLVGAVGTGGFFWGASTRAPAPDAPPAARLAVDLGDERSVDPCALLSEDALRRFGTPQEFADFGLLTGCRIDLATSSGEQVAVGAYLDSAAYVEEVAGDREALGDLEIRRPAASDTSCERWIVLPDRTGVQLLATRSAAGATDLCAVADAAATSAAVVLADTAPLPTRTLPAPTDRLAAIDVCTVVDDATLRSVPGLDVGRRAVGYGGWGCTWGVLTGTWFRVTPTRLGPFEPAAATSSTVAGRQVWTSDYDTPSFCEASIVLDEYVGSTGNSRVNVLTVQLGSSADPCGQLGSLMPGLVSRLPA